MENTEINTTQTETFTVNREIKLYLAETAKWGNILAIIGYVAMGIMALASLVMIVVFSFMDLKTAFPMWIMGLVYLPFTVALFSGNLFVPVFAQMKQAVRQSNEKLYTSRVCQLKIAV
ncbi:MAG: hypothetical protein IPF54_24150 [Draconibacterium sp.]|nr:hypothetical protein [Draconibacterium sp.]